MNREWRLIRPEGRQLNLPAQRVQKVAEELKELYSGLGSLKPPSDIRDVAERIRRKYRRGEWDSIVAGDKRKIPWCLWLKPDRLADEDGFLQKYLEWVRNSRRRSLCLGLIGGYLREFEAGDKTFVTAGDSLKSIIGHWEWLWPARQKSYLLFNATQAPGSLATRCLATDAPSDLLKEAGLEGHVLEKGLAAAAFSEALRLVSAQLIRSPEDPGTLTHLKSLLAWAGRAGQLTFPELRANIADQLLAPFRERTPPEGVKRLIESFLLGYYGHPRIRGNNNWMLVSQDAVRTFLRWLVAAALEQFFDVVDRISTDAPWQWRYRRAFWWSYYEAGHVSDAWVAFAGRGQGLAARMLDRKAATFGKLRGGCQSSHAVLMLRIGDLVIGDWNVNGKCHIWHAGNKFAPVLYEQAYDGTMLKMGSDFDVVHGGAERGTWQGRIADYISQNAPARMTFRQYMPVR